MKIELSKKFTSTEAVVIPFLSEKINFKSLENLPESITEALKTQFTYKKHTEKNAITETIALVNKKPVLVISYIVDSKKLKQETTTDLGGKISQILAKHKIKSATILDLPAPSKKPEHLRFFLLGFLLSSYKFDTYLTSPKQSQHQFESVKLISSTSDLTNDTISELQAVVDGIHYTRDLVNLPPNHVYPKFLTAEAQKIAKKSSRTIKVEVFDEKKMAKHKMGLILGVGAGSHQESQMIFLEYKNKPTKGKKPIVIVGKGITFDAGGLNIKPTNGIEDMKSDMAGAANVLGLMQILSILKPQAHIIGVIAAAENLLGDKAMKPGDILTATNGKTVEITNTDAEGRLVLADAIAYSIKKYDPEYLLDMATLTGACIVALSHEITGAFTNTPALYEKLQKASHETTEQFWQLPIIDLFRERVASKIADYKNWTASVKAGASMGAAFLEKFVGKTPWIHLDIAGPSWSPENRATYHEGATGRPLHTLWVMTKQHFSEQAKQK
jgi:leucyl aminopeptidase